MKKGRIFICIALLAIVNLYTVSSVAQNDKPLVKIETKDGNEFVGNIVSEDEEKVVLLTETLGEITLRKINIVRRSLIDKSKLIEGVIWDDNPQSTRYLWTPNAYGLKQGEGYYQNIWVLYNQVSYGVTDMFSLSGGLIPTFLFGAEETPVWIVPKLSIPVIKDALNIGAGVFAGTTMGDTDSDFGIAFGTVTLGNRDMNLTLGLGWGYTSYGCADYPILNISAMIRTSARGYILTENYLVPLGKNNLVLLSVGGRYVIKKVGIDFGLYLPFHEYMEQFIALPMVGVTLPLGKTPASNK